MADRELEIKFYLTDKASLQDRLAQLGGRIKHPRVNEWNLRFDTPGRTLSAQSQALRLRKDERVRLTYKGSPDTSGEITNRVELEVTVSDFETTRRIFEALGYQVMVIYEKFRTTWEYAGAEIVVDELPVGDFCEIEAGNEGVIRRVASDLNLAWEQRITTSYLGIFDLLREALALPALNLTFSDLAHIPFTSRDLAKVHIHPADR